MAMKQVPQFARASSPESQGSVEVASLEESYELLRLAFLLTGDRETGEAVFVEALDFEDMDLKEMDPYTPNPLMRPSRTSLIAAALNAVDSQMTASARRTELRLIRRSQQTTKLPSPEWSMEHQISYGQMQDALLAIDFLPRCALLLITFEKMLLRDVAALLNLDGELVATAHSLALVELTQNIALAQGWVPSSTQQSSRNRITISRYATSL